MSAASIKGWCPGALQPMLSGDGLVVRVRPRGGQLNAEQAIGIAALSKSHGNGLIDLTSRANLQIRGVSDLSHPPLIDGLGELGLLDPDPEAEARRNILITPFWSAGDDTISIAAELEQALACGPDGLPNKFGFAVDCGSERVLADASADVRIERDAAGELMVRADGAELGRPVQRQDAVKSALALAQWFVDSGGAEGGRGRMAAHIRAGARLPDALSGNARPAPSLAEPPRPKLYPQGAMVGFAFGQITHAALGYLGARAGVLRITPWRIILAEGLRDMPTCEGLITRPDDPMLRVIACSGAPRCTQAHADTRALAAALAPNLSADASLHVSGCAKGCAHSGSASVTLVATAQGFDVVRDGAVSDAPALIGVSGASILSDPALAVGKSNAA
jgi:precorrin-3B synthase